MSGIFFHVLPLEAKNIFTSRSTRKGSYGRGSGVGRGLGDGVDLGAAVGVGVAVAVAVGVGVGVPPAGAWIATIIGEPVLKNPTLALAACGG